MPSDGVPAVGQPVQAAQASRAQDGAREPGITAGAGGGDDGGTSSLSHQGDTEKKDENESPAALNLRFRFKGSRDAGRDGASTHRPHEHRHPHKRHRRHHHHHHRHHEHRHSRKRRHEDTTAPPPSDHPGVLSPEEAFRESLFDALADDEGASYWEGIYSQPIHTYARGWVRDRDGDGGGDDDGGEGARLRQMTDDEYAEYVRGEMWKKTHEGLLAERAARAARRKREEEEREREREEQRRARRDRQHSAAGGADFERLVDESLRRGRERHARRQEAASWAEAWCAYAHAWEGMNAAAAAAAAAAATGTSADTPGRADPQQLREMIHWPVRSGERRDVTRAAVEAFMRNCPAAAASRSVASPSSAYVALLKTERVRWHPDKVQHKLGALGVAGERQTMQGVTEVFQIGLMIGLLGLQYS
ncbi:hypothetical protein KEM52_002208 [Ascosphaera acerosa]|nr:hypothetical protein KEM52_002208 [Ascosphaera acerosa]